MSDVTDEMVKAAWRERVVPMGGYEDWRVVIAAALAAAPTVGPWFWCERVEECATCDLTECIGPHHAMLLGPEVTT